MAEQIVVDVDYLIDIGYTIQLLDQLNDRFGSVIDDLAGLGQGVNHEKYGHTIDAISDHLSKAHNIMTYLVDNLEKLKEASG